MRSVRRSLLLCLAAFPLLSTSCAAPRYLWPQDDIAAIEINDSGLDHRVLVASRSSEFKDAVIDSVRSYFAERPVYVRIIGLDALERENAAEYDAILLVSTCMGGGFDRHIEGFLGRLEDHSRIVVLTTAGDAGWQPDKKGRSYDAVTTASVKADAGRVAASIVERINALLGGA